MSASETNIPLNKITDDKLNNITDEIETINKKLTSDNIDDKVQAQKLTDLIKSFTANIELIGNTNIQKNAQSSTRETYGDVVNLWIDNITTIFSLGKIGFVNNLFNSIVMPILETAGIDKDLLNYVLTFLKNPTTDEAGLEADLATQKVEEAARMAKIFGKSGGDVAFMLSQALARTALFTIYPGIGETIAKLNKTLGEIKEKIEMKFGLMKTVTASANKAAENTVNKAEEAAKGATTKLDSAAAAAAGGSPFKKINKTKVKRRIHNSIKKFYKTNNLKTLKREIQRMKKRFTRGNK